MHFLAVDFYQCIIPDLLLQQALRVFKKKRRSKFFRKYKDHALNECVNSIDNAVNDEITSYEELDGINIMTDARQKSHGWRKNSKDTSVVALGEQTHKVMNCVHITKSHDKVAQRLGKTRYSKNL